MRKFLLVLAMAIFLYSPYGPSWGQAAVNMSLVLLLFGTLAKGLPKRRYR
jgi:hypothetical protein